MQLHMDNFSIYGTNTALMSQGRYVTAGGGFPGEFALVNDPDGVSGGKVLYTTDGATWRVALPASRTFLGQCIRWFGSTMPTASTNFCVGLSVIYDASAVPMAYVNIDNLGRIRICSGGPSGASGTVLATTAGPVVTAGSWWHVEVQWTSTGVAGGGGATVRVEGQTVLTATGLTFATNSAIFSYGGNSAGTAQTYGYYNKDLYVYDNTGSYNNTWKGSLVIQNQVPASDVALNWTSTGANGYSVLANIPPNDAQYISAAYPGIPAAYECTMTALANTALISSVAGVITVYRATKADGGDGQLQLTLKSASATAAGLNRPILASMNYWMDSFEVDPNTTNPFIPSAVNAMHLQLNRTV